jgi:tRNA threonylcarbamoyladenosine biosynthesis protein TsaE
MVKRYWCKKPADKGYEMLAIQSERAMLKLGELLGEQARPGDLLFLFGDLGTGKTTLTKGIARGLGIDTEITSPTFQLMKSYDGRLVFNHLDLYRLEDVAQLAVIAPEEFITEGVTVVEWGQLLLEHLSHPAHLEITIRFQADDTAREVSMIAHGPEYDHYLRSLIHASFGN